MQNCHLLPWASLCAGSSTGGGGGGWSSREQDRGGLSVGRCSLVGAGEVQVASSGEVGTRPEQARIGGAARQGKERMEHGGEGERRTRLAPFI
jgi:hypothetical protein